MAVSTTLGQKIQKTVRILSTQAWVAPFDVTEVDVILCGGGAGGQGGFNAAFGCAGGSGSATTALLTVVPGTSYTITIGAGSAGGTSTGAISAGGTSSFGALLSIAGGGSSDPMTSRASRPAGLGGGGGGLIYFSTNAGVRGGNVLNGSNGFEGYGGGGGSGGRGLGGSQKGYSIEVTGTSK